MNLNDPDSEPSAAIELATGVKVTPREDLAAKLTDWDAIRSLVEGGLSYVEAGELFGLKRSTICQRAKREGWLTPFVVGRMKAELSRKQRQQMRATGNAADVNELKAQIWQERGESLNEKAYKLIDEAMDAITPEQAKKLIKGAHDLRQVVELGRVVTGQTLDNKDGSQGVPAINIAFLRPQAIDADSSASPIDV